MIVSWFLAFVVVISQDGELTGTVTDVTGGSIRNAFVRVLLEDSGRTLHRIRSDEQGRFRVGGISPGVYTVRTQAPGFREAAAKNVAIRDGESRELGNVILATSGCDDPVVSCFYLTQSEILRRSVELHL